MKLSIITINYNNIVGLQKTIESVLAQDRKDFEYIIIDGGSTDGSVEVIQSFTNIPPGTNTSQFTSEPCHPISYWISEPDKGIYNAMNKGIRQAKGEYCQFLNSGDWLASPAVSRKMLQAIPARGILIGNMLKVMVNGKVKRDKGMAYQKPSFLSFYRGTLNHSSAYIKRELFEKYGLYDETLDIVSDWKWYLQVVGLKNEPVKYMDFDVSCFDMTGVSTVNIKKEKQERRQVLQEILPVNILADYDEYWLDIYQARKIKKYILTRSLFWFVERILFKFEKWSDHISQWRKN